MTASRVEWDVTGRRVLVTGASSSLAMAQALARGGARVALGGRDDDRLARAIDTLDAPAGEVRPVQIDCATTRRSRGRSRQSTTPGAAWTSWLTTRASACGRSIPSS